MTSQFPSLQTYSKERPNYCSPSVAPFGLEPSRPSGYQPYMRSEFQNMPPLPIPGRGPIEMNVPIVSGLAPSFESPSYLTGSASEPGITGNNGTIFFPPPHLPHPYYGYQTMTHASPMQAPFHSARSPYPDGDNHREIPIIVANDVQGVVPVSNINPPFSVHAPSSYSPPASYPPGGSIPGAHYPPWYAHTTSPSESTGDAPGSASPTALQQRTFIDGSPHDVAKGTVASYPILKASEARRRNPAPFSCEQCRATFTRSHNLSYHMDAHRGIKKHSSLCGKKFGTPSGSKRHQGTCPRCKGASGSLSPG